MKAIILKTKPYSFFRLGAGSKDEVDLIIHSDTLFSALVNMHSQVFENTNEVIKLFINNEINISSAFPLLADEKIEKIVLFLPKPELEYNISENIKAEKKIKFISFKVWEDIVKNSSNNLSKLSFTDESIHCILNECFVCLKDELNGGILTEENNSFITQQILAKTKVHSTSQEDSFYHETNIQLQPIELQNNKKLYPHFYFLLDGSCNNKYLEELYTCLRLLADEGIGGERSTGKGHFDDIIIREVEISDVSNAKNYFTVSLSNPINQEEFSSFLRYEIITRGGGSISLDDDFDNYGFDTKPYRKKQVRMISEGALVNKPVKGRLVDISPDTNTYSHKIYRNGKSFLLPVG